MIGVELPFEEYLVLFRTVVQQLSPEERWKLVLELARDETKPQ